MTDSILLTVKKMLGIAEEYHAFDLDIIMDINSAFLTLNQLGVGPIEPYQIKGDEETWKDFQGETVIPGIQTYVYLKTRLLFDPPTNSFLVDNIQKRIDEFEWRLNIQIETPLSSVLSKDDNPDINNTPPSIEKSTTRIFSPTSAIFQQKILSTLNNQTRLKGG